MITPLYQNKMYNVNFESKYSAEEICTKLCKGSCCNHSAPMGAKLKRIADSFTAKYWDLPEDLKSTALIKSSVLKWVIMDSRPEAKTLEKMINIHMDALRFEQNAVKRKELAAAIDELNAKLEKIYGPYEVFVPVTNQSLVNNVDDVLMSNTENVCMFKDHNKTNRCMIYNGVKSPAGEIIERPSACTTLGSSEQPCPWLNPEKLDDIVKKTRENLAKNGYRNLPNEVINNYVAEQYNLNQTWYEKIFKPFLENRNK